MGNTVIDTDGREWTVTKVIQGPAARRAQIQPGFGQINIQREGCGEHGVTLFESTIDEWLAGRIRVRMLNV